MRKTARPREGSTFIVTEVAMGNRNLSRRRWRRLFHVARRMRITIEPEILETGLSQFANQQAKLKYKFYFNALNAQNQKQVNGDIEVVEAKNQRLMEKMPSHQINYVKRPNSKDGRYAASTIDAWFARKKS